jgi:hypothetical protein
MIKKRNDGSYRQRKSIKYFLKPSAEIYWQWKFGEKKMHATHKKKEEKLFSGILRLNAKILGMALGLLLGLVLFIATNWMFLKGDKFVGPHLQLLNQYFIGYRVSFVGSLIGFAYGFALGTLSGALLGWIYNKIVAIRNRPSSRFL